MFPDEIILAAVRRASAEPVYTEAKRPESQLVRALYRALIVEEALGVPRMECRFNLDGWTRPPGGVDLSTALADGSGSIVIEAKVDKPEEAIWDVIKLADILALDSTVAAAYLIYDARLRTWARVDRSTDLFTEPDRLRPVRELIEGAPEDWAWLLEGGRGIRPRQCVGAVQVTRIGACSLATPEGHELRVLRVSPDLASGVQCFDVEGWPAG